MTKHIISTAFKARQSGHSCVTLHVTVLVRVFWSCVPSQGKEGPEKYCLKQNKDGVTPSTKPLSPTRETY